MARHRLLGIWFVYTLAQRERIMIIPRMGIGERESEEGGEGREVDPGNLRESERRMRRNERSTNENPSVSPRIARGTDKRSIGKRYTKPSQKIP